MPIPFRFFQLLLKHVGDIVFKQLFWGAIIAALVLLYQLSQHQLTRSAWKANALAIFVPYIWIISLLAVVNVGVVTLKLYREIVAKKSEQSKSRRIIADWPEPKISRSIIALALTSIFSFLILAGFSYLVWVLSQSRVPPSSIVEKPSVPESTSERGSPARRNGQSPQNREHYDLSNITEAIWFGVYVRASAALKNQFKNLDQNTLQIYDGCYCVNSIDSLPPEIYKTAWQSAFGKLLICDAESGISSSMNIEVSEHPYIAVLISNNWNENHKCEMKAYIMRPTTSGDTGFVLTAPTEGRWPRHAYILDLPGGARDFFALRFFMNGIELKQLTEGCPPLWKSFVIKNEKDFLRLQIYRKGATTWASLPDLERLLPDKITLMTDLLYDGPKIVREYKLISNIPQQIGRGDDASQIVIWALSWKPIRYAEGHSEFSGN